MAELDRSSGRLLTVFMTIAALVIIVAALVLALNPTVFSPSGAGPVGEVTIVPEQAARDGAQWRLVSHWGGAGLSDEEQGLYLIEFKSIPGWVAPSPVVLKKGQSRAQVKGVYRPVQYQEETVMRLTGSPAMAYRLMPELVQKYLRESGADDVRVLPGAVPGETVVQGIYFASRKIVTAEIVAAEVPADQMQVNGSVAISMFAQAENGEMSESRLPSADSVDIGKDGIAVVVHNDNPVTALTLEQIGEIFSGEVTNWKQVGGPDRQIRLYVLPDSLDLSVQFQNTFMKAGTAIVPSAHKVGAYVQLSEYVAQDPWSIGFTSTALTGLCRVLPVRLALGAEAVLPTPRTLADFEYPAVRRLGLTAADPSLEQIRNFLAFCGTGAAQELVSRYGFVSTMPAIEAPEGVVVPKISASTEVVGNMTEPEDAVEDSANQSVPAVTNQTADHAQVKSEIVDRGAAGQTDAQENATDAKVDSPPSGDSGLMENSTAGSPPQPAGEPDASGSADAKLPANASAGAAPKSIVVEAMPGQSPSDDDQSANGKTNSTLASAGNESAEEGGMQQVQPVTIVESESSQPVANATGHIHTAAAPVTPDVVPMGAAPLPALPAENKEDVPDEARRKVLLPYWNAVKGAQRMPVVFGFETGSISLNSQALSDLGQVAELMRKPEYAGKQIILVGFSDYSGTYASNLAISSVRANVVAQALIRKGVQDIQVVAAGEEEIIESSPSLAGREKNRRVEVWLK